LKVFEFLRNFSQKVSKGGAGAKPRRASADKSKFIDYYLSRSAADWS
jgi:hypothetical protein